MGRARFGGSAALLVAALCAASRAGGASQEVRAERVAADLHWSAAPDVAPRVLAFDAEPPAGVQPPPSAPPELLYAIVPLGEAARIAVAIDARPGREQIWMDHDLDGDLADDDRAWWTRGSDGWTRQEQVVITGGSPPVARRFTARLRHDPAGPPEHVEFVLGAARSGLVHLGGRMRDVLLLDGDHDALFDLAGADRLYADLDGDGVVDTGADSREQLTVGRPFRAGAEAWTARLTSPWGERVEFDWTEDVPPPRPRRWKRVAAPPPGLPLTPPRRSLHELRTALTARPLAVVQERLRALAEIGRVGTEEAFALLHDAALGDRHFLVRAAAVRAMGNPRYRDAHAATVAEFTDGTRFPTGIEAVAAIEALHAMDAPGRGELYRELVVSRRRRVKGSAARHLAYLPDVASRILAVAACADLSLGTSGSLPWHDRLEAYRGVRTLPAGPSPDLMVAMAQANHPALLALALGDLRTIGHSDTRKLALHASKMRSLVWNRGILPFDPDEASPYVAQLYRGRRDLGDLLIRLVGSFDGEDPVVALRSLAQGVPLESRAPLVHQLAARRRPDAVDAVIRGLRSIAPIEREITARALAGIPGEHVTRALVRQLRREREVDVASAMIDALSARSAPAALDAILAHHESGELPGQALRAAAHRAPQDTRVRRLLREHLGAADPAERVRGIAAVASSRDPELTVHALPQLAHENWSVRVAAIDALRAVRLRESASPLIAQLAREGRLRLRLALADALFELTGMDLGPDAEPWQSWFSDHGADFVVPDPIPVRRAPAEIKTASFFGLPIDSDHATFVMDRSGSMKTPMDGPAPSGSTRRESRLEASMREAIGAARALPDDAFVNLLLFHFEARAWKNRLVPLNKRNRTALESRLRSGFLGPQTDVFGAVRKALRDPASDTILLLTDGVPTTEEYADPADLLAAIARLNETSRVAIHCVSLGRDSELLRRLAAQNSGRYVRR